MIISATGHRPKYLPCGYVEAHPWLLALKDRIREQYALLKPDAVISGMALGFDMWVAEVALEQGIPLHCYLPFPNQGDNWPVGSKKKLDSIKSQAAKVINCSPSYSKTCFTIRDFAMVENSQIVLGLWDPTVKKGGTFVTKNHAISEGREFINIYEPYVYE